MSESQPTWHGQVPLEQFLDQVIPVEMSAEDFLALKSGDRVHDRNDYDLVGTVLRRVVRGRVRVDWDTSGGVAVNIGIEDCEREGLSA
ncbi:MAG TPA: hypothetical protein VMP11_10820 [Verrucomicrobiae bacterium]|nr:hypothetical protein [Verrucomicrobiae bacterium]